jgi:hypothetical protein
VLGKRNKPPFPKPLSRGKRHNAGEESVKDDGNSYQVQMQGRVCPEYCGGKKRQKHIKVLNHKA